MVSAMKIRTKCTEDTKICLAKFRGFMHLAKQAGRWREMFQARGLYVQSPGVLGRITVTSFQPHF